MQHGDCMPPPPMCMHAIRALHRQPPMPCGNALIPPLPWVCLPCRHTPCREPRACTRMLESMGGLQRIPMLGRLLYVAPYEPKADAVCQY